MTNGGQMHANLVRPAGFDLYFEQRELAVHPFNLLFDVPMRNGFAATTAPRRHARAANKVPADRGVDGPPRLLHPAVDQRGVGFLDLSAGELLRQLSMRDRKSTRLNSSHIPLS